MEYFVPSRESVRVFPLRTGGAAEDEDITEEELTDEEEDFIEEEDDFAEEELELISQGSDQQKVPLL